MKTNKHKSAKDKEVDELRSWYKMALKSKSSYQMSKYEAERCNGPIGPIGKK